MSDIFINRVVIHELVKEQHQDIKLPNIRKSVLDPKNKTVDKLVCGIAALYGNRNNSAHYGTFRESPGGGSFPAKFDLYSNHEKPTNENFIELTKCAMDELQGKAESAMAASGGYILFADYSNVSSRFFIIAMIKQKEGIKLSENLEPEELTQLDMNRLHQAARINFGKLAAFKVAEEDQRQDLSYLSFISPNIGKTASGYFVTALGCARGAASSRATDTLIRESTAFFRNNDDLRCHRKKFKDELLDYLKKAETDEKSVKLSEVEALARKYFPADDNDKVDELANSFVSHLNSEEHAVPVEFPVSKSALRKHTHIIFNSDNWDIKFERHAIGTTDAAEIFFDKEKKSITFNRMPDIMIQKIEEELESRKVE